MADQSSTLQQRLSVDPRYQQAWKALQASLGSAPAVTDTGDRADDMRNAAGGGNQDAARQAFGNTVRQIVSGYGVENPEDYVIDPSKGQIIYQPDHSLRNSMLLLGAVALGGGAAQYVGDAVGAGAGASGAASSTLEPSTGANIAATSAATTAPESIAAGGGSAAGTAGAAGAGGAAARVGSKFIDSPLAGAALSGGLGALENLFAPRRNSFADGSATDPRNIMKQGLGMTNDLFGSLSSQLKAGVDLPSARAGNPPSYSGPSLPMNFGVTGSDPAQRDPSLQHLGFNDPRQPQPAGDPTNPTSSALAAFRMLGVKV